MRNLPEYDPDTDNGVPVIAVSFPPCEYGCGGFAGECDCAEFHAEMVAAFESPLKFGWTR